MTDPSFPSAITWYHGLTLAERVATLRMPYAVPPVSTPDQACVARCLQRWYTRPYPARVPITWRTSEDGITEAEIYQVIAEPVAAVAHRYATHPAWINTLVQTFARFDKSAASLLPSPEYISAEDAVGWLYLVEPLILNGCFRLHKAAHQLLHAYSAPPFDPDTIVSLWLPDLFDRLKNLLAHTMLLELNVMQLQNRFPGTTSRKHIQAFCTYLRQPQAALALLQNYAVLARQVVHCIDQWVTTGQEFFTHLCVDCPALQATFAAGQSPGHLVRLVCDQSNRHRGGRVLIATFASGLMLVYKPRSLAVESHFQAILRWLNVCGAQPPFRSLRVLDRGDYGWVEWVWADPCPSAAAAERFYRRQGGYLALLAVLGATDIHCENFIAAGEHPVLIDLETLLHVAPAIASPGADPANPVSDACAVLQIGLLPIGVPGLTTVTDRDMSGLGGLDGHCTPESVPETHDRPVLHSATLHATGYVEAIVAGFTAIYRLLLDQRPALLAVDGPLAALADIAVRTLVRPTRVYNALLDEALQPDLLRSGLSRDRFFDHLWSSMPYTPIMARVITAERADLQRGDIPIFQTRPTSQDVWDSNGNRIPGLLPETGMQQMQRRIARLGMEDMTQQIDCIRLALHSCPSRCRR